MAKELEKVRAVSRVVDGTEMLKGEEFVRFVMNAIEEVQQAFEDYRAGRFGHIAAQ